MKIGDWVWSEEHGQSCQVIEVQTLWGNTTYRVWLPTQDVVVRLSATQLKPLSAAQPLSADQITYIATAARIADALTQDVLLAPIESNDYNALFAPSRQAFVNAEETIVCHGGISLEEVIVPYIQLDLAPA